MSSNRLIFKTSTNDEVYYFKDTIFVKFNTERRGISTSQLNGGIKNYNSVFNHHLTQETIDYLENHSVKDYLADVGGDTGLITLAKMKNASIITKMYKKIEITAITTAGVRVNAARAGDAGSYYEENGKFGTINTILLLNSNLTDETLVESLMTAVEAKTVALNNLKIPSQFSNGFATGTGTDGIAIFSNPKSDNVLTNAGKHSKLGELIAQSIINSIYVAIRKQVWITPNSQSNVLVLLNRYKLDINKFYDTLNQDKYNFIKQLQMDCKKRENVAIASSILNLFDDVGKGIIDNVVANRLANNVLSSCNSYCIKELLNYWIDHFL